MTVPWPPHATSASMLCCVVLSCAGLCYAVLCYAVFCCATGGVSWPDTVYIVDLVAAGLVSYDHAVDTTTVQQSPLMQGIAAVLRNPNILVAMNDCNWVREAGLRIALMQFPHVLATSTALHASQH